MSILKNQLKTWAKLHQTQKAKNTHEIVRKAIKNFNFSENYDFEDYLQGSYRNNTNIWSDTDVDIVIQLNSIFECDISNLFDYEQDKFNNLYTPVSYNLKDFKDEVIQALKNSFGDTRIKIGNKSIKVLTDNSGNMHNADVVVVMQYRLYTNDDTKNIKVDEIGLNYYEGILFKTLYGEKIVNYPKLHYQNDSLDKVSPTLTDHKGTAILKFNLKDKSFIGNYYTDKRPISNTEAKCNFGEIKGKNR
jgi:hypothetical protein